MPGSSNVGRFLWPLALAALAFALRLTVIVNAQDAILFADMQDYYDRALHLLQTGALTPDAFRVPLYPIFIAAVFKLFGPSLTAVRIAQALLGAATVALTYVLARRVTTHRGAIAAAFLVAVYPALVLYSVYLMAETLFAFLVVLALTLWTIERPWVALAAGGVLGAATLTRSTGLALAAGIACTEIIRLITARHDGMLRTFGRVALMAVGFVVVVGPWVQRNQSIYGRLIATDTSSGFNALLGNYEGATGRHPGLPAVDAAARKYWSTARNDLERSDVGMSVARDFVRDQPMRAAGLALRKVGYLFGVEGREHAWGYSFHVQGRREPSTVWAWGAAIIASFPIVMTLAVIGMLRPGLIYGAAGAAMAITLLFVTAIHVASFGDSRFHLPWVPFVVILACRAFAPQTAGPWTMARQTVLAIVLVGLGLAWQEQARELWSVLPRLAESPTPLQLPY